MADKEEERRWDLRFDIREEVANKGLADKGLTELGSVLDKLLLNLDPAREPTEAKAPQVTPPPFKRVRSGGINVPTFSASISGISSMFAGQGGGAEDVHDDGSKPQWGSEEMNDAQRAPRLSSGGGAACAEPDRSKGIRSERSPERSETVARLVRAMLLFDQYSKTDSNAPNPGNQTSREDRRAPGVKTDKVLGVWEQQQILRHSGLKEIVSERCAGRALASAAMALDLSKVAASSQEGAQTDRPRGRAGEKKSIDKRLHYAWICAIAEELGVRDAVVGKVMQRGDEKSTQAGASRTTSDPLALPGVPKSKFYASGILAMLAAGKMETRAKERQGKTDRGKLPRVARALDRSVARALDRSKAPPAKGPGTRHEDTTYLLPLMMSWKHAPEARATMFRAGKPRPREDPPPPEAPWLNDATGRLEPLKVRLEPLKRKQTRQALNMLMTTRPNAGDADDDSYYAPPGVGRVMCTVLVSCPVLPRLGLCTWQSLPVVSGLRFTACGLRRQPCG